MRKERVVLLCVGDDEAILAWPLAEKLEVKPIAKTLGIDIILQNEVKLSYCCPLFASLQHIHQVTALKARIKLVIFGDGRQSKFIGIKGSLFKVANG